MREKWVSMVQDWYFETERDQEGFENERCPLCRGEEGAVHILLKCSETRKWREIYLGRK
jgi:hypothetical protein